MNQEFEALLHWQANLADRIIQTQEEILSLEKQEKVFIRKCGRSLGHFYLGLNDEHQVNETQLQSLQIKLKQKREQLVQLQNELEKKIDEIIKYYRKVKEASYQVETSTDS